MPLLKDFLVIFKVVGVTDPYPLGTPDVGAMIGLTTYPNLVIDKQEPGTPSSLKWITIWKSRFSAGTHQQLSSL